MDQKEELRNRINSCLNRLGRYHLGILSLFGIYSIVAGSSNTVGVFYTFTPDFYCGVQDEEREIEWNQCSGVESPSNCTFDPEEPYNSIVTEFQLLCSYRYLAALSNTIFFSGVMVGALIFSPLSDYIGRKRTLQLTTTGHLLMGLCLHFKALTSSIGAFIAFRFVQGAFNQGMQLVGYAALMELTPVRLRTLFGCLWEGFWAVGLVYLGSLSMANYDWRTLQLYLLIPIALGVIISFLLPESLHWQWTQNQFRAVVESYSKIAKRNGDKDFAAEERQFQRDKHWQLIESQCKQIEAEEKRDTDGAWQSMTIIFRNLILRKHLIIVSILWFSVTMCYYAITFFLPNLAGDRHTNFIIGAGIEAVGFAAVYFAMQNFGRAKIIGIFMIVNATMCITYAVVELVDFLDPEAKDVTGTVLLLMAKGLSVSGFCGMLIITGELFPTICRGSVYGLCGFFSRCGSLLAPQIVVVTEFISPAFPMFLLGGLLLCSGSSMFLLPETLKIQIPNNMEDVEELWGKRKNVPKRVEL